MGKRYASAFLWLLTLFLNGCEKPQTEKKNNVRTVKVFHISTLEKIVQRNFPGIVEASDKVDLSFLVPGQIIELPVKEGDQVKTGQLIARVDPKDYEIAVAEAQSKAELAEVDLERTAKLLEKDFASRKQYDAYKTAADVANAKLQQARQNLKYTMILAPFSGEIAKKYVENFQNVLAKKEIVKLQNRQALDIKVQIPESLVIRKDLFTQGTCEAEFETAPDTRYKITVKEIPTQASEETQTYTVTFILSAPKDLTVLPDMTAVVYAKVQLISKQNGDILIIPPTAVFNDQKGLSYVWMIEPSVNTLKKQEVKVGKLVGSGVMITQGLSPGQNIVAAGAEFLEEGMVVKPYETSGD